MAVENGFELLAVGLGFFADVDFSFSALKGFVYYGICVD
jgi:hypothetical protein